MASYDDMLGDAEEIMFMGKYKKADHKETESFKLWNFALKAAPKAGMEFGHEWAKLDDGEDTQTDLKFKAHDAEFEFSAMPDSYTAQVSRPLLDDDFKVQGSIGIESSNGDEKEDQFHGLSAGLQVETPDMSGATTTLNFAYELKKFFDKNEDNEQTVDADLCVTYEKENQLGAKVSHNIGDKETEFEVTACHNKEDDKKKYAGWAGYTQQMVEPDSDDKKDNVQHQFLKAGCMIEYKEKNFVHAYEARWILNPQDPKQKFMGVGEGMPLQVVAGGKYNLSDKSTMNYSLDFEKTAHAQMAFQHQIDDKWSAGIHQTYDFAEKNPYKVGLSAEYTL